MDFRRQLDCIEDETMLFQKIVTLTSTAETMIFQKIVQLISTATFVTALTPLQSRISDLPLDKAHYERHCIQTSPNEAPDSGKKQILNRD